MESPSTSPSGHFEPCTAFSAVQLETPPPESENQYFLEQIRNPTACPVESYETPLVAVIGVGYVGLHLVTTFATKFKVIAFDVSKNRLEAIKNDVEPFPSVQMTSEAEVLADATHFLVSVPTTLLPDKCIDISSIQAALRTVGVFARPGATVVIESSVSVGMTRRLLRSLVESKGIKAGISPEGSLGNSSADYGPNISQRVDPGRVDPPLHIIPKIISGLDDVAPGSLDSIYSLYSQVFENTITVSKPEVAEMTKLYENCQRMMCIAYANEMADACESLGINPYEVSLAATTKPFGYQPYMPGIGVGGHSIPVNPYYLMENADFPLLQAATEKMWKRPACLADKAMNSLRRDSGVGVAKNDRKRILVVGVGSNAGQSVTSCSPGVAVLVRLLEEWDVEVAFADPLVEASAVPFAPKLDEDIGWNKDHLQQFDLIMVTMRQSGLDFGVLDDLPGVQVEWYCP